MSLVNGHERTGHERASFIIVALSTISLISANLLHSIGLRLAAFSRRRSDGSSRVIGGRVVSSSQWACRGRQIRASERFCILRSSSSPFCRFNINDDDFSVRVAKTSESNGSQIGFGHRVFRVAISGINFENINIANEFV